MRFTSRPFAMTPESYRQVTKAAASRDWRRLIIFALIVLCLGGAFSFIMLRVATAPFDYGIGGFVGGAGFGVAIAFVAFVRAQVEHLSKYSSDPANATAFVSRVVTIDDVGFSISYANGASSFSSWGMLVGWQETSGYYRLHYSRVYAFMLPCDAFEGEARAFLEQRLATIPLLKDIPPSGR